MKTAYLLLILALLLFAFTACTATKDNTGDNMKEIAVLETSKGTIEIELNRTAAPTTVENFIQYVKDGHYDNTVFHRVIKSFMVQGGGFTEDGNQKRTRAPIKIESNNGLKNIKGTIAMARTADPNSATSQFFINTADNDFLNYGYRDAGYTVFGKVITGMDVITKIESAQTATKHGMQDWPKEEILIKKAYMK